MAAAVSSLSYRLTAGIAAILKITGVRWKHQTQYVLLSVEAAGDPNLTDMCDTKHVILSVPGVIAIRLDLILLGGD